MGASRAVRTREALEHCVYEEAKAAAAVEE